MNLYLDLDDIRPEFQELEPTRIRYEHLTEEVQKVVSKFGSVYLTRAPYIGPYVEIEVPKSALPENEFKIAKLDVQPGDVIIVMCEGVLPAEHKEWMVQAIEGIFPDNKGMVFDGDKFNISVLHHKEEE